MADTAAATPAKSPKKKTAAKPKKPMAHPTYSEMVGKAISALKERGGSSRQAILKYIMANFNVGKDAKSVNAHLKLSLRAGVKNKSLKQSKGTGASGSFRIGDVEAAKKPAKAKKAAKPKAAAFFLGDLTFLGLAAAFFTAGFFAFGFFVFGLAAFFSPTAFFAAGLVSPVQRLFSAFKSPFQGYPIFSKRI
jgi:histone H1/5